MARHCPDCDVEMTRVEFSSAALGDNIRIQDPRKSSLGGIVGGKTYLEAHLCEECDLVRFYATT